MKALNKYTEKQQEQILEGIKDTPLTEVEKKMTEMKEKFDLEDKLMEMPKLENELIHKRMNDINTFQAHENEVYLRGTDEYGKDFQICFDSYNFLEWIDTEHLKYIKEQLVKHIKTK
tara:strand:+ start:422 stop:772 length:351 start_codon:yes stop_codon:yes gene_type:complete